MKKLTLILAALCMTATLTACGGGGSGSTAQVASANTSIPMNATTGQTVTSSVTGKSFEFTNGVPDFGTSGSTTVTFGTPNGFQITSGGNAANGTMSFGSCHFNVTSSSFGSGPLINGSTVTITNCELQALTKGLPADGSGHLAQVELVLNGATSLPVTVTITVMADGQVLVNNVVVGSVPVAPVTGA